ARPGDPSGRVPERALSRRQGSGRPRQLRRRSQLASSRNGAAAALPDRRGAAEYRDHTQLRLEGDRRPAARDAAGEGARPRPDPAAGRPGRQRAARPARPRVRPRRDRGLAAAVRRARAGQVRGARVSPLEALARRPSRRVRAGRGAGRRMAGRHAADRDPRGGERIPPARARSRLALALAALAIAEGVAVYGTLEADRIALLVLALGSGSVALIAFG